jgi:hypothetical protein
VYLTASARPALRQRRPDRPRARGGVRRHRVRKRRS